MDDGCDVSQMQEGDFDKHATYFVRDRDCSDGTENKAKASLPRNLYLKSSQTMADVSYNIMSDFLDTEFTLGIHTLYV